MMAVRAVALVLVALAAGFRAEAEDYVLTVDGVSVEIDLGRQASVTMPDGRTLSLLLEQKEYLRFSGEMFSFEHKSRYRPSRSDLGGGVHQTMIVTPVGTGVLIQEYRGMNPKSLVEQMVKGLTEEEVGYGYAYAERPVHRTVGSVRFEGKEATTTYKDEQWRRSVLAYGSGNRGLLVVTFIEKDNYEAEGRLIERLWDTLSVALD